MNKERVEGEKKREKEGKKNRRKVRTKRALRRLVAQTWNVLLTFTLNDSPRAGIGCKPVDRN